MIFLKKHAKAWLITLLLGTALNPVFAALPAGELQALVTEADELNTQFSGISLSADNMCSELRSAHTTASTLINHIEAVNSALSGPVSIDIESLQALDDLSNSFVNLAITSTSLSQTLGLLNSSTDMFRIKNSMTAMLRLSDDIGIMANRILEMADKILIMADNIGLMADRIIITQQIQSENLALTQASLLQTQQNILALAAVTNSNNYNTDFDAQTLAGNLIAADISTTALNVFNMSRNFAGFATDVEGLLSQVNSTHQAITDAVKLNSVYIDASSLTALADMSIMVSSVSIALQGLSLAAEGLSPITRDTTLTASVSSILQLSSDIGAMANRILEMADLILAMADNIGLTADQIIATQQLQSSNYAATLASIEAIQIIAVNIITANNL